MKFKNKNVILSSKRGKNYEQQTYKLYKAKKLWVTALAGASMFAIAGIHQQAQADEVSSSQTATKSTDTGNTSESTAQQNQTAGSQGQGTASTDSQSAVTQGLNPQSTASQNSTSQSAGTQENTNNNSAAATSNSQRQGTSSESATQSQSQQEGSTAASNSNQSSQTKPTLDFREATDATSGTSQPVTNDNLSATVTKDNFLQWFKLNGSATYDADTNITTLTTDQNGFKGNITLNTRINANDAFELHGTINLGSKLQNGSGADGISIAFHHVHIGDIGTVGGGIIVLGLPTSSGYIFDTWTADTGDHSDGKGDSYVAGFHSDVDQQGMDGNFRYDGGFLDLDPSKYNIAGQSVPFTITYDGNGHMGLTYLGQTFSIPVTDFQDSLALSIGASTGAWNNTQTVSVDSFTFIPVQNNTVSRTVNYVDQNGNKIAASTVQSAIYRRQGTLVNNQPTYTDWQLVSGVNSNSFAPVTAPTIDGYTVENNQTTSFSSLIVDNDSGQLVYNVVYDKNSGQTTLNAQDSTIVAGPSAQWSPSQNFLSAVDQNGSGVDLSKIQVSGSVQTKIPGSYPITYTYTDTAGKTITKTVTVTVVPSKSSLQAKDSTIFVNTKWNPSDNVISATDENGNVVDLSQVQVADNVDTSTPGSYPVTYTYTDGTGNQHTETVTVTVTPSKGSVTAKDSTVVAGPNTQPVDLSKVTVSGNVDTNTPGSYQVTYTYTDGSGNVYTQTVTVTVAPNATSASNTNHDSSASIASNQGYAVGGPANATAQTTIVLPQTGHHQAKSTSQKGLEIGLISATFGLILLMKRNQKNGID